MTLPLSNSSFSKPSNAVLRCTDPVSVRISGEKDGTRDKFISRRCRECWECVTSQKNDIVGKLLAGMTTCTRVWLWTLTYDGKTADSRFGSKQRIPKHIQLFQKACRQRERRALRTYNRREKKAAAAGGREPKLVDTSKSYLQFYPVFEFGSKNGRGHWHVIVFEESHFPLALNVRAGLDPEVCPVEASRVWVLPEIRGAETPGLPPDANNPEVIDCRVRKHGSQRHALWKHGFVNIECLSHDVRATDFGGNPVDRRLAPENIVRSCFYLLKYLSKPHTSPDGRLLSETGLSEQNEMLQRARGGNRLYRTGSRGLGREYALQFARSHALVGVPLHHVHFRVQGANVPRTPESLHKLEKKLAARGLSELQMLQYIAQASKMVFQMQGGMLTAAADEFIRLARDKNMKEQAFGDVAIMRIRQLAAQNANEWLRSPEGDFKRRTARDVMDRDHVWARKRLRDAPALTAQMVSGVFFGNELPRCVLPPEPFLGYIMGGDEILTSKRIEYLGGKRQTELEKLEAALAAIELLGDAYRRVGPDPLKVAAVKLAASADIDLCVPFHCLHERRSKLNDDEYTQAIYEQTVSEEWERFFAGDNEASDLILGMQLAKPRLLPQKEVPWSIREHHAPAAKQLRWLNFSDDYNYPASRERYISAFCAVRNLSEDRRLLITPDGRVLAGVKGTVRKRRSVVSYAGKKASTVLQAYETWGYTVLGTVSQVEQFAAGQVDVGYFNALDPEMFSRAKTLSGGSAPIFEEIPKPFKNIWAMRCTELHKAVLALPAPNKEITDVSDPEAYDIYAFDDPDPMKTDFTEYSWPEVEAVDVGPVDMDDFA